jgi:hypothetical protein
LRIAYSNLIDEATTTLTESSQDASYPVENVQDQRLSTIWKSTGATEENVIVTLPTFPEYPDASAGTLVMYNFATSAESFVATKGTIDVATYPGILRLTATSAGSSIARATGVALTSSSTIIMKMRSPDILSTTISVLVGVSVVSTITGITTTMSIYSSIIVGGASATTLTILGTNTASTGTVYDIDGIYIGNGTFTTQLTDSSDTGNDLNVFGSTIIDGVNNYKYLYKDGINDYEKSESTLTTISDIWFYHEVYKGALLSTHCTFYNYLPQSTSAGFLWIYRPLNGNVLRIDYCTGVSETYIDIANFFTGYDNTFLYLDISINWLTKTVLVYRNGSLFSTNTMTTPVKPVIGYYHYFGVYQGILHFSTGIFGERKLYNRTLSEIEINNLYTHTHWLGEYDGLVGDWSLNKNLGVNTVAVLGHNIKTGTTVKIQANNSNEWGDPPVNTILTVNPETILNFYSSTYYYKYWKFYFGQGLVEIGRLWLSEYLTINPSSLLDFKVTKKRSDTVIHGKNRQKWASEGVGWRRFELIFPRTEEAMIYLLTKMYDTVGNHSSIIFANFDTLRDWILTEPCYCSIDGDLALTHTHRMGFTYTLNMEEEK